MDEKKIYREVFVTDMGKSFKCGEMVIPRYGVWAFDSSKGKHQVFETTDDLEDVFKRFGRVPVQKIKV